jgi:integrase
MSEKIKAHRKTRPDQVVFQVGEDAIAAGLPEDRRGAFFIVQPGYDRGTANAFLADLNSGRFADMRAEANLPWLQPGKCHVPVEDSQHARALSLAAGLRWLDKKKLDLTTVVQGDIERMGKELLPGRRPGTVAEIQTSVLYAAQWYVWSGLRTQFHVSVTKYRVNYGRGSAEGYRPNVMLAVPPRRVRYLDRKSERAICAAIDDPAKRIAVEMLFGGLRGSEPGSVRDQDMPTAAQATKIGPNYFSVTGKGNKTRSPEASLDLVRRIDRYRLFERPARVAKFKRLNDSDYEPEALLLNDKNGNPLTRLVIYRAFKEAALKLGIKGTPHWARHAFAANFLADGVVAQIEMAEHRGLTVNLGDLDNFMDVLRIELMLLMGHASFDTSKIYLSHVRQATVARLAAPRLRSLGVA